MVTIIPSAPPGSTPAEKYVFYLRAVMRVTVVVMCGLCLFSFGSLADKSTDSDSDLNFVGSFFAIVANAGYMLVATLILLTQFNIKFLMKHLNMLYYWPVQAGAQVFMGVQTLNSKAQLAMFGQDNAIVMLFTSLAGYTFVVCGVLLFILSVAKMNKEDLSQFRADVENFGAGLRNPNTGGGKAAPAAVAAPRAASPPASGGATSGKPKATDSGLQDSLLPEDDIRQVQVVPETDGDFPFASAAAAPEAIDPFAQSGRALGDDEPRDPAYSPPVAESMRKAQKAAEDDELERMYAAAQGGGASGTASNVSPSGFAAAD